MISESKGRFFLTRLSSHVIRKQKKEKITGFVIQLVIFQAKKRRFFMSGSWDFLPLHIKSSGQFPDLLKEFRHTGESNGVNYSLKLGNKLSKVGMEHYFWRFPSSAVFPFSPRKFFGLETLDPEVYKTI